PVYQVGDCDGQAYFCMEFVEGKTLAQLIAEGPLPQHRAAAYLLKIARAVHHAHERGILHRDLKPANVLIDGNDEPLVTDFGLAKRTEAWGRYSSLPGRLESLPHLTGTGAILGTPSYMAPEQCDSSAGQPSR